MQPAGKTFLVTGGASGLGEAVARRLVKSGAAVIICDVAEHGLQVADDIGAVSPRKCWFARADVADEGEVRAALALAKEKTGRVDGLVNCAGVGTVHKLLGKEGPHPLELFERTLRVNLVGTFNTCRLAAEFMLGHEPDAGGERGVIINTASVAALEGQIGQVAYAASKGGVAAMTLPLARELARHAIRCCTVAPGIFDTPMLAGLPEKARESLGAQVPFPARLGDPDEFAQLVLHIVENPMLNGALLRLDGAIRLQPR